MARKRQNVEQEIASKRPRPPDQLFGESQWFRPIAPADGVAEWVQETFLREDAPLFNEDHKHLFFADIAYLWAAVENKKHMRQVIGQCEEVAIRAGGWQRARQEQQFHEWFGRVPQFLITLDAHYVRECGDLEWCRLIEHELYHVGHRLDDFGQPAFTKDGFPKFGLRGHDVEEFVGVVRRYGAAADSDVSKLIAAARVPAQVGHVDIAQACGTCMLRAA